MNKHYYISGCRDMPSDHMTETLAWNSHLSSFQARGLNDRIGQSDPSMQTGISLMISVH